MKMDDLFSLSLNSRNIVGMTTPVEQINGVIFD